jgi:hypothetical protein
MERTTFGDVAPDPSWADHDERILMLLPSGWAG